MSASMQHLDAIVVALLSVNSYPVEAACRVVPRLRQAGLLDADQVGIMDAREVAHRLAGAGYNRGGITDILAPRLQALVSADKKGELDRVAEAVAAGDVDEFAALLLPLPGVGPKVVETAWLLLGPPSTTSSPSP